jgi:hypothetical protein
MESIAATNPNSKFTALQYPMTWGGNSEAVKVPFYFTLRLMNETNINNITNSYIYDSSMATVWGTPGIRNDTNKYWKGGNIGYAIPLSNKGNTINHSFYSVDINGISYSGFKTAPQSQYLADVYNSYINKRKIAAFNSIPQRPICLPMFNSRLRYWNTPINYTQTLQNPHTHYFSLLYNYFLGFFGNTISSFPYFSFNINCSKRTGPDTGADGRPGTVDQTLQIGNQPETLPGFFDNDLIETTYLKITRIKKRV